MAEHDDAIMAAVAAQLAQDQLAPVGALTADQVEQLIWTSRRGPRNDAVNEWIAADVRARSFLARAWEESPPDTQLVERWSRGPSTAHLVELTPWPGHAARSWAVPRRNDFALAAASDDAIDPVVERDDRFQMVLVRTPLAGAPSVSLHLTCADTVDGDALIRVTLATDDDTTEYLLAPGSEHRAEVIVPRSLAWRDITIHAPGPVSDLGVADADVVSRSVASSTADTRDTWRRIGRSLATDDETRASIIRGLQ